MCYNYVILFESEVYLWNKKLEYATDKILTYIKGGYSNGKIRRFEARQ